MFVVFYQKVSCKVMVSSEVISETVYSLCACDALFHVHNYFSHLPPGSVLGWHLVFAQGTRRRAAAAGEVCGRGESIA